MSPRGGFSYRSHLLLPIRIFILFIPHVTAGGVSVTCHDTEGRAPLLLSPAHPLWSHTAINNRGLAILTQAVTRPSLVTHNAKSGTRDWDWALTDTTLGLVWARPWDTEAFTEPGRDYDLNYLLWGDDKISRSWHRWWFYWAQMLNGVSGDLNSSTYFHWVYFPIWVRWWSVLHDATCHVCHVSRVSVRPGTGNYHMSHSPPSTHHHKSKVKCNHTLSPPPPLYL